MRVSSALRGVDSFTFSPARTASSPSAARTRCAAGRAGWTEGNPALGAELALLSAGTRPPCAHPGAGPRGRLGRVSSPAVERPSALCRLGRAQGLGTAGGSPGRSRENPGAVRCRWGSLNDSQAGMSPRHALRREACPHPRRAKSQWTRPGSAPTLTLAGAGSGSEAAAAAPGRGKQCRCPRPSAAHRNGHRAGTGALCTGKWGQPAGSPGRRGG